MDYEAFEDYADTEDGLVIHNTQFISDDFLRDLAEKKANFRGANLDGYTEVAEIPEALVDHWIRQGFDFYKAPAREIIAKLRADNMENFIVSGDYKF